MTNLSVENVYTRANAKELTKKHFGKLLGMTVIAFGIPCAMMIAVNTLTTPLAETQPGLYMILYLVLALAVSLGTCGLSIGLLKAMIDLCRGEENLTARAVFSRMGYTLKAFGLGLWVQLKTFLWMLPGYIVMIAGLFIMLSSVDMWTGTISESAAGTMVLTMIGGILLMLALGIPAAYRYLMSTYILADKPETGVFACVRESKAMMKGHKWQAFKLIVPVVLIMYVIMLVFSVAFSALSMLVANSAVALLIVTFAMVIAMIFIALYYMIRMYLCYALFYVKRVDEQTPAEESAEAPSEE